MNADVAFDDGILNWVVLIMVEEVSLASVAGVAVVASF